MKRITLAFVATMLSAQALAQTQFPSSTLWGNITASTGFPTTVVVPNCPAGALNYTPGTGFGCGGGGGGGGVATITSTGSTLTVSGSSTVNLDLNLSHANTWTAMQTLSALTLSSIVSGSSQCLRVNGSGVVGGTGADCGSGGTPALTHTHLFVGNASNVAADYGAMATLGDNGTFLLTPPAGNNIGFLVNQQSASGGTGSAQQFNAVTVQDVGYNGGSLPATNAFAVNLILNSSSIFGGRQAFASIVNLTNPTNAANALPEYVAVVGLAQASTGDNGSNGAERGTIYGSNFYARVLAASTFMYNAVGGEDNIDVQTTAPNAPTRIAIRNLVSVSTHAAHGRSLDGGLVIGAQAGSVGMLNGILFSKTYNGGGSPIATTGTLIKGEGADTIAGGVDISNYTISGLAWKSNAASIDGAGNFIGTSWNKMIITAPATSSTLTIANNKTLTVANTLNLNGTDGSTVAFGGGGTVVYSGNNLSVFSATTSAQLASVLSDETGSGLAVFSTSPTLTTPIISNVIGGVAANSSLTLQSTNAGSPSGDQIIFKVAGVTAWTMDANGLKGSASSALSNRFLPGEDDTAFVTNVAQIYTSAGNGLTFVMGNTTAGGNDGGFFSGSGGELFTNPHATNNVKFVGGGGAIGFGGGAWSTNGSVATVLGSLGPVGSHTAVQKWFTINDGTNTYYIPAF